MKEKPNEEKSTFWAKPRRLERRQFSFFLQ